MAYKFLPAKIENKVAATGRIHNSNKPIINVSAQTLSPISLPDLPLSAEKGLTLKVAFIEVLRHRRFWHWSGFKKLVLVDKNIINAILVQGPIICLIINLHMNEKTAKVSFNSKI